MMKCAFRCVQIVLLLFGSRANGEQDMNVWSRHSGSQNVPHVFSCSCLKVVWFRGVIMVFLILWLNDVPIEKSKIVKRSAAAELAQLC